MKIEDIKVGDVLWHVEYDMYFVSEVTVFAVEPPNTVRVRDSQWKHGYEMRPSELFATKREALISRRERNEYLIEHYGKQLAVLGALIAREAK